MWNRRADANTEYSMVGSSHIVLEFDRSVESSCGGRWDDTRRTITFGTDRDTFAKGNGNHTTACACRMVNLKLEYQILSFRVECPSTSIHKSESRLPDENSTIWGQFIGKFIYYSNLTLPCRWKKTSAVMADGALGGIDKIHQVLCLGE
jgi:hypothetical protein